MEDSQNENPLLPATLSESEKLEETEFDRRYKEQVNELAPEFQKTLKKIAFQISQVGLSIEEACLYNNVDYDWFKNIIATRPIVGIIIKKKEIEYKSSLLKPIMNKVRKDNDPNLSQWLLEKKFPNDFGKRGSAPQGQDDLKDAVEYIQRNGDTTTLVRKESQMAIIVTNSDKNKTLKQQVEDLLV